MYIKFFKKGFTMVELLVAMGIFLIVVTVSSVIFVNSLKSQRLLTALMAVNDNAVLSLEQMTREIRTGTNFSGSDSELIFVNAKGESAVYRLDAAKNVLEKGVNGVFSAITADNVEVKTFRAILRGHNPGDGEPPRITVSLRVSGKLKDLREIITNLQTTVSARNIDT
jgi:prepilin-type N-terminal cleavage/methylation domain-containing protein